MNKILGIVLIFAAAWLMFKLQADNGSSNGEVHDSSDTDPENRLGCALESRQKDDWQQDKKASCKEDPDTDRQDKS